jgi:hypothetical protein
MKLHRFLSLFMSALALAISSGIGFVANASTFVGNGGNAGDVEWNVTLKQVQAAVKSIIDDPVRDDVLCSCNKTYSNASICDALTSLSHEQRLFCGQSLKRQVLQLQPLVRDNNTVHVSWTTEAIDVLEDGHRRAVDAVTDRRLGQVTLNADRFRSMNPSERVFLISHELMHLTKFNDQPLTDEGPQGPFTSSEGSRQLVNAMAAAMTIEAEEAGAFDRYRSTLNRPQGWKKNWLDLTFFGSSASPTSVYGISSYTGASFRYTHYFNALGVNAEYSGSKGNKTILSSVNSNEDISTFRLGASYRLFPFKNPLSYFGQSNLVFSADLDFVKGTFNLTDPHNDETETSNRVGVSGTARYYVPIVFGFWGSIAESYVSLPAAYTISGVRIEDEKNVFATSIGVSYAF